VPERWNSQDSRAALVKRAVDMFVAATPPVGAPISDWRQGFERLCAGFDIPRDARIEEVDEGGVHGLTITAKDASSDRLVMHLHSGGYVMGSSTAYRNFGCRLSEATRATVFLADYRLAPEHPYPAAVDDAVAAFRWCGRRHDASRTIISGDSAGGGLAIATLLALRDAGAKLPAAGVAISPLLDLAGEGDSMRTNAKTDPLIDRTMVVEMGKVYIGDIDPHQHPLASPLWGQHHDLPPLLLTASASEVLKDDAVRLAESVRQAGGRVTISLPDGMVHIWTLFPFLREAGESMTLIGNFARECWSDGGA
jgi:acetyl esterase/lipase